LLVVHGMVGAVGMVGLVMVMIGFLRASGAWGGSEIKD
jgi:hypothetical protein